MMGAGIAYECARAGMEVVLKDMTLAAAEKGKAYSQGILDKAVARGKMTAEGRDEILARITPTENMADAKGADLMIEAVFEDPNLKKSVYAEVVPLLTEDALLGSNTSPCRSPAWPRAWTGPRTSSACTSSRRSTR